MNTGKPTNAAARAERNGHPSARISVDMTAGNIAQDRVAEESLSGVCVVGGGPAGLATACALSLHGLGPVTLLERRPRHRDNSPSSASFNFTLVPSTLSYLRSLGISVADSVVPIRAREFWTDYGRRVHSYGRQPTDQLFSSPRHVLVDRLYAQAQALGVDIRDGVSVLKLDVQQGRLLCQFAEGWVAWVKADFIVAADGANSRMRADLVHQADANSFRETDGFCYASATIDAEVARYVGMRTDRIHFAVGHDGLDIAIGNQDGSFSLILERHDRVGIHTIDSHEEARRFTAGVPDRLYRHVVDLEAQLCASPVRRFLYAQADVKAHGKAVLIGDAGRCVPPYLGRGVNGALDDARLLAAAVRECGQDWGRAAKQYTELRSDYNREIEALSRRHGRILLGGRFGTRSWRWRDRAERVAEALFGYRSPYQRMVFDLHLTG